MKKILKQILQNYLKNIMIKYNYLFNTNLKLE